MPTRSRTRLWLAGGVLVTAVLALLLLLRGCAPGNVTVIAVGDMACSPTDPAFGGGEGVDGACQARAVSDLALSAGADMLWGLGDYQYELPSAADFATAQPGDQTAEQVLGVSTAQHGFREPECPGGDAGERVAGVVEVHLLPGRHQRCPKGGTSKGNPEEDDWRRAR